MAEAEARQSYGGHGRDSRYPGGKRREKRANRGSSGYSVNSQRGKAIRDSEIRLRSLGRPSDVTKDLMNHVDGTPSPRRETKVADADDGHRTRSLNRVVPKNLASFQNIEELLPVFERARVDDSMLPYDMGVADAPDAVAAMNHFKRLQRQARRQSNLSDRLERVLHELAQVAEAGMPYMSAKNVALALNSVSHRQGFDALFHVGVQRIELLCTTKYKFHAQSLAMMVNALVKRRLLDSRMVRLLSQAAQSIPPHDYSPQSVAIILNAFSKVARHDSHLFLYMSEVAVNLDERMWDAQACALLLNSFARTGHSDIPLFLHFEAVILKQDIRAFTAQNVANIVNAYAKCGFNQTAVLTCMSAAARALAPVQCDAQAVANILNGFSRLNVWDAELFAHLTHASLATPTGAFSAQAIANTLNAHARMGNRDLTLFAHMSRVIRESCDLQGLGLPAGEARATAVQPSERGRGRSARGREALSFDPQAVANIVNAFARLGIRDELLFDQMHVVVLAIPAARWDSQAVALVLNAYARMELYPQELFEFLAGLAADLPAQTFNAQAIANIANAMAKAGLRHEVLLDRLALRCLRLTAFDLTGQAVSSILNAYAKLDHPHPRLFEHMASVAMEMPLATFQPQAIANIVNAYVKVAAGCEVPLLFARMSAAAQRNLPRSYSGQAIGVILNAYVRQGQVDAHLFQFISRTIVSLPPSAFDAQNIALVTNAFAKAEMFDEGKDVFRYMAEVASIVSVGPSDAQNVAVVINAYAKADLLDGQQYERGDVAAADATAALMDKLARDIPRLSREHTNAQAIGNIVNGFGRYLVGLQALGIERDEGKAQHDRAALRAMAQLTLDLKARDMDAQSLTLLLHSFSRVHVLAKTGSAAGTGLGAEGASNVRQGDDGHGDLGVYDEVFRHLSNAILQIPVKYMDVQAVASMLASLLKADAVSDDVIDHLAAALSVGLQQSACAPASASLGGLPDELAEASSAADSAPAAGPQSLVAEAGEKQRPPCLQFLVLIVSGFARAERALTPLLMATVSAAILEVDSGEWNGQSCSNLLNGMARLLELRLVPREEVEAVFGKVSEVVRSTEVHMFEGIYDAQNMAIMCNAMARIDYHDEGLLLHLSLIIQQMHPDQFDVQAVSNIVNAYVKLDAEASVRNCLLDFMSVVAQCFDADEEFSPQSISNIVNAYAKADMVEEALPLFEHMALAAQLLPPEAFNAQAVANIVNAYAKISRKLTSLEAQVDLRALLDHMSLAAQTIDATTLDMQNIANMINALAKTYTYDAKLLNHLGAGLRANAQRYDLSHDSQALANVMHGLAILNHRDGLEDLTQDLVPHIARLELSPDCQTQGVANICWSCAVMQLRDPALLDWCRRAISSRLTAMNWSCLRQVQQFVLTLEMDGLLPDGVSISEALPRALTADPAELASVIAASEALVRDDAHVPWSQLVDLAACCLVRSAWSYSDSLGAACAGNGANRGQLAGDASKQAGARTWRMPSSRASSPQRRQMQNWVDEGEALATTRRAFVTPEEGDRGPSSPRTRRGGARNSEMTARVAYGRVLAAEASASRLQAEVAQHVAALGFDLEEEYVDEQTGYSVDAFISRYKLAVEVDGPFHFIANGKAQLGSTVMKHRLLRQSGMLLVVVPYFEWNSLNAAPGDSFDNKLAYLRAKLEELLPPSHVWPPHLPPASNFAERQSSDGPDKAGVAASIERRQRLSAGKDKARARLRGRLPSRQDDEGKGTGTTKVEAGARAAAARVFEGDYLIDGDFTVSGDVALSVDYVADRD